jgi:hypothetical protein
MAKKRSKRRRSTSRKQEYPGWVWMLFGLAIGLSVAFAIFVRDRQPAPPPVARQPASLESAIDENGEPFHVLRHAAEFRGRYSGAGA